MKALVRHILCIGLFLSSSFLWASEDKENKEQSSIFKIEVEEDSPDLRTVFNRIQGAQAFPQSFRFVSSEGLFTAPRAEELVSSFQDSLGSALSYLEAQYLDLLEYFSRDNESETESEFSWKIEDFRARRSEDIFRRMPLNVWNSVIDHIFEKRHTLTIDELEAFHLRNWDHEIFEDQESFEYLVFQAYLADQIDQEEFCTLLLYRSLIEQSNEENTHSQIGKINSYHVLQIFDADASKNEADIEILRLSTQNYLNEEDFERLILDLSGIAPERTQFFALSHESESIIFQDGLFSELQRLSKLFLHTDKNGDLWQLIPSPQFAYRILRARHGGNTMQMSPAIGFSRRERLSDVSRRVVFLPSSLLSSTTFVNRGTGALSVEVPTDLFHREYVHNLYTCPLSVYFHDLYHHSIEAANVHRQIWTDFAFFLKDKGYQESFYKVIDREFKNYWKEELTPAERFRLTLLRLEATSAATLTPGILLRLFLEFYESHPLPTDVVSEKFVAQLPRIIKQLSAGL